MDAGSSTALLDREESEHLHTRWSEIQGKFVDEPRSAVQQADALVTEVIEKITQMFVNEHSSLESQWNQGNDVTTEDLRQALQHYRAFFNRLVV
jgi:Na+/phosphate symporter